MQCWLPHSVRKSFPSSDCSLTWDTCVALFPSAQHLVRYVVAIRQGSILAGALFLADSPSGNIFGL